ncbi:hypothetical protein [Nereida sp. MMG025]|uniref:hypothetical protein n=1 Tax=Nereida sp. MMG025 TaxID=2909981 RepID=UPI001F3ED62E|nr:hypothetical protein [Nereida sp. MMG025]MCF6446077.1 hypothetical protein [Nereida sp. MMG025]
MQDLSEEDRAYLTRMMDLPDGLALAAHDGSSSELSPLNYETDRLLEIIDRQLPIIATRRRENNSIGIDMDIEVDVGAEYSSGELTLFNDRRVILSKGLTPRQFYRIVLAMLDAFPQPNRPYVVLGDIGFAWLRTDLPEDEAVLHMITHDDGVRATLGLPAYDHSQW